MLIRDEIAGITGRRDHKSAVDALPGPHDFGDQSESCSSASADPIKPLPQSEYSDGTRLFKALTKLSQPVCGHQYPIVHLCLVRRPGQSTRWHAHNLHRQRESSARPIEGVYMVHREQHSPSERPELEQCHAILCVVPQQATCAA